MSGEKTSKGLIGAGVLTAIFSSLCCIAPVLALVAGSSGLASTFSWIESARPYFIGITALVIAFAWYNKLKNKSVDSCGCDTNEKPNFIQSKKFLAVVSIFACIMVTFPYYSHIFFPEKEVVITSQSNIQTGTFNISGMTCEGCEAEVKHEVNKLNGIVQADVSYANSNAQIEFDNTKTTIAAIEKAIISTGYQVSKYDSRNKN